MATIIVIPAGTPASKCTGKGCEQTIYFAPNPWNGKSHPVSIEHALGRAPEPSLDGQGISHFTDCTAADEFRKKKAS